MRRVCFVLGCLALLFLVSCGEKNEMADKSDKPGAVASLVAAERAFAAEVETRGIVLAFRSVLGPHGVIFNPTPLNGLQQYQGADTTVTARLTWEPIFAEVSGSDDLGYTTGPWEYFPDRETEKPVAVGDYLSIWNRNASGVWELALDLGVSRSESVPSQDLLSQQLPIQNQPSEFSVGDLRYIDSLFAQRVRREGFGMYDTAGTEDIRILRDNTPRIVGKDALAEVNLLPYSSSSRGAVMAAQGDLGYVYGVAEGNVQDAEGRLVEGEGGFVRIWRKVGDELRLAAEVMSMRPKQ